MYMKKRKSFLSSTIKLSAAKYAYVQKNLTPKDKKLCDIRFIIPGNNLLASAQCKTFEEAIVQSVDGLVRQMEKKKAKIPVR